MNMEADIMIDKILKRIFVEKPNIPVFSCHDGLFTTEKYKEEVLIIMEEEFRNVFGIIPTIKVKI